MAGRLVQETTQHYKAFLFYWGLGKDRNLAKVQQEYNVSLSAVKKWSTDFSWKLRLSELERKISEKLESDAINTAAALTQDNLDIIANLKARYKDMLNNAKVTINLIENIADLDRVMKLERLMMDKPTERIEGVINIISAVPSSKNADD